MSHFTSVRTEIRDMEALKKALEAMNLRLEHNIPCRYYEGAPYRENVVRLPGPYDMALEMQANGAYNISADLYRGHVEKTIGRRGCNLMKEYSIQKLRIEAQKLGYKVYSNGENNYKVVKPGEEGKLNVQFNEDGTASFKASGFKGKSCMKFGKLEEALGAVEKTKKTADYYQEETKTETVKEWL